MAGKLDHIGIFVESLEKAIPFYRSILDHGDPIIRNVPELGLKLAFFAGQGGELVELVETSGKSEMKPGDVVVAFEVQDLAAEIARLKAAGIKAYHQKATENLPLERGWITKGDGLDTIIELCPKGAVRRFVMGSPQSGEAGA